MRYLIRGRSGSPSRLIALLGVMAACGASCGVEPGDPLAENLEEVAAQPDLGFHFPYLLYVPPTPGPDQPIHLLVEPCNTGTTSDDFAVHRKAARRMAGSGYPRTLADGLGVPLLVPIFPRPQEEWRIYTHALDRDTMLIEEGDLRRIDLQLIAMIDHARARLKTRGVVTQPRVFMHGFSASGTFGNRFAALHPERVRAVASGGVNGIPIYPRAQLDDTSLPYPIGVADLERLMGRAFDATAYATVAQFIYMGFLDRNDTLPFDDAWNDDERRLIINVAGEEMMPARWIRSQAVLADGPWPIQCVTYQGTSHAIRPEMLDDLVAFFNANRGDDPTLIEPHEFPFVAFRELTTVHVNAVYWNGDPRLPERHRKLRDDSSFAIGMVDWLDDQDHGQMSDLLRNAGFDFIILAGDREVMRISQSNLNGLRTAGKGALQVFEVRLDPEQLAKLEPGVSYRLQPLNPNEGYDWIVDDGVALVRPE